MDSQHPHSWFLVQILKIRTYAFGRLAKLESLELKVNNLSVHDMDVHLELIQESLMEISLLYF